MTNKIITDKFSVFARGYRNRAGVAVLQTRPYGVIDIPSVHKYVTSDQARPATELLRSMIGRASDEEIRDFKKLNFHIVCIRGIFHVRKAAGLDVLSRFLPIDIDDLASTEEARQVIHTLVDDEFVDVAMAFVSPKGRGAKVFVELPDWAFDLNYRQQYELYAKHIMFAHGIGVDLQCSDLARAAFLCHDSEAYLNPKYLIDNQNNNNHE